MTGSIARDVKPGSFRGVPFMCAVSASDETGRRLALHRYPQRDEAFAEDLGKKSEPFEIEAIVLGRDWLAAAERLHAACGQAGPGELVHPWLGVRRVVCQSAKRSFQAREGGIVKFALTFFEAGENVYPASVQDAGLGVRDAADNAIGPAEIEFSRSLATRRQSSLVRERLKAALDNLRGGASDAFGSARNSLGFENAQTGDTLDIARDILGASDDALGFADGALGGVRNAGVGGRGALSGLSSLLLGDYGDLMDRPSALARRTSSIARLLSYADANPAHGARRVQSWNASGNAWRTDTISASTVRQAQTLSAGTPAQSTPAHSTPARATAARNERALGELLDRASLAAEARRAPDRSFDSREAALAYRDDLAARLGTAARRAADLGDDGSAAALLTLRARVSADLTQRAGSLDRVARLSPRATQPAFQLAWQIYGDDPAAVADRADEIARRNRVRHPGFVAGGRTLEVLLDGR